MKFINILYSRLVVVVVEVQASNSRGLAQNEL